MNIKTTQYVCCEVLPIIFLEHFHVIKIISSGRSLCLRSFATRKEHTTSVPFPRSRGVATVGAGAGGVMHPLPFQISVFCCIDPSPPSNALTPHLQICSAAISSKHPILGTHCISITIKLTDDVIYCGPKTVYFLVLCYKSDALSNRHLQY